MLSSERYSGKKKILEIPRLLSNYGALFTFASRRPFKKKEKKSLTLRPHVVSNLFLVQFKIKIRSELFTEQRVGGRCKSVKTVDRRQDDYGSGNRHFENPLDNQSNHMTTNMTLLPPPPDLPLL